jgi:hypothetical protein
VPPSAFRSVHLWSKQAGFLHAHHWQSARDLRNVHSFPPAYGPSASVLWDGCVGFLGGSGGSRRFPGFVTIWQFQGLSKERQRGLYQPFILLVQLAGLALSASLDAPAHSGSTGSNIYLLRSQHFLRSEKLRWLNDGSLLA